MNMPVNACSMDIFRAGGFSSLNNFLIMTPSSKQPTNDIEDSVFFPVFYKIFGFQSLKPVVIV
jgi:hypothetical protein